MVPPSHFPVSCPGCRAAYQVPVSLAGLTVTCEACGGDFTLDSAPLPAPDLLPEEEMKPTAVQIPHPEPTTLPAKQLLKNGLLVMIGAGLVVGISTLLKEQPPSPAPAAPGTTGPTSIASGSASVPDDSPEVPELAEVPPQAAIIPQDPVPPLKPAVPEPTTPSQIIHSGQETSAAKQPSPMPLNIKTLPPIVVNPPALPASPANTGESLPAPPAGLPARPVATTAPSPALPKTDPVALRKDSLKTLEQFLRAPTMEERLALSQNPDKVRGDMATFHESHPTVPFELQEITFLTEGAVPDSSRKFHLYNVQIKGHEAPIPMAVEETPDGYRVDWPAFVESYTHRLRDFFASPTETPGRFRVMLRRAHYFGPPVPGQDKVRLAYTVEPPMRDETFHIWVDKESLVYQEKLATGERSGWDAESYVIVELVWRGDDQQGHWVSLHRITSDSWRSD